MASFHVAFKTRLVGEHFATLVASLWLTWLGVFRHHVVLEGGVVCGTTHFTRDLLCVALLSVVDQGADVLESLLLTTFLLTAELLSWPVHLPM